MQTIADKTAHEYNHELLKEFDFLMASCNAEFVVGWTNDTTAYTVMNGATWKWLKPLLEELRGHRDEEARARESGRVHRCMMTVMAGFKGDTEYDAAYAELVKLGYLDENPQ